MRRDREQGARLAAGPATELGWLLGEIARGRHAALRQLYDRTSAKLYGISLRLLGDEAEAQDVLQEVYTLVWRKAERYDSAKASAITWLAAMTRNKAIDRLRARRAPTAGLDEADTIADDSPTAFEILEQSQDATRLSQCLDKLEERARTMIRSAFFDGSTYPELAESEGVPLGTMKSWVRRGLLRLRLCLEQ
jgi:RNA polymerase sigma-70 factor (ECF subfamily)